ncbi:hypothetical protein EVAR_86695_1 [Eumeta japonica]|uniref:Nose resistant to fluoxetine protein 6 n=1 Tax=Eumeta variegata TaxID=151549 RepID=A0A4C1XZY5_EUMVA|nr:hypothetical protein EVAR_86695_1 [Eumeta japonica]
MAYLTSETIILYFLTVNLYRSLRQLFAGSEVLRQLYLPSYMNGAGYVCGLAVAYLHYANQQHGRKLNQKKWFSLAFHLSLLAGSAVVAAGSLFLHDHPPAHAAALYAGLDRTLVAVCFNVFLLGCFSKCKSALRSALEWPALHALGRLSYCAFLLHFVVLRVLIGSNTQLPQVSVLACVTLLITCSVLTYLVSVPVCLLVEIPFVQLWKALTDSSSSQVQRPQTRPAVPVLGHPVLPPHSLVKSFDLVANVRHGGGTA